MLDKYRYTESEQKKLLKSIIIIVDSQEKVNAHITNYFDKHKIPYIVRALECGDYSFYLPKNEDMAILKDIYFTNNIIIERKNSAGELASSFSQSRTRFESEFLRSQAEKKYLLIEKATYGDIINHNYENDYSVKSYLGSIHSFNHKFNLEIVYMPDNNYSAPFIYGTFQYYLRNLIK